mgnify:CR=1 FL=1
MIKKNFGYKGKIIWNKKYPDGMKRKLLDVSLMKKMGFKTQIDFEIGLKKVIRSFKESF